MRAPRLETPLALGLAAALALAPGCRRRAGPSEHYDKGAAIHQQLYVTLLDDAWLDPRMDEAVAELRQVPADSVSHSLAQDLLGRIDKGRREATAARDERARAQAEALRGTLAPPIDPSRPTGAPAPPAADADAGPAAADPYGPGAAVADINAQSGGCLVAEGPFREDNTHAQGVVYRLAAAEACKDKLPGFAGQAVLAVDGRIYRRVPAGDLRPEARPDAGPPTDAGAPAGPRAVAAPQAAPPVAGASSGGAGPPAYEGQQNAPRPVETPSAQVEETKGVRLQETQAAKMEDVTPQPAAR